MSDRIAVFNAGGIEQLDTPAGLYEHPRTPFVAGFVGTSNSFDGAAARTLAGRDGTYVIRPERLSLAPLENGASAPGVVREVVYLGSATHTLVELDAGPVFTVSEPNSGSDRLAHRDDRVQVFWQPDHLVRLADPISPGGADPARPVTLQEER